MKIVVFCSCSTEVNPLFFGEMEALGEGLAEDGHEVIYGGTHTGSMGALARGVLRKGGRLIGVVPRMDFAEGLVQEGLSELHEVDTLSGRKEVMMELADAFVVYPGGLGTLDEVVEVLALKSVGMHPKPVYFYNFLGVWTPFLETLQLLEVQRMIRTPLAQLFQVVDKVEALRDNLRNAIGAAKKS